MMSHRSALKLLKKGFKSRPIASPLSDTQVKYPEEASEIERKFAGKTWAELAPNELEAVHCLEFLSTNGFFQLLPWILMSHFDDKETNLDEEFGYILRKHLLRSKNQLSSFLSASQVAILIEVLNMIDRFRGLSEKGEYCVDALYAALDNALIIDANILNYGYSSARHDLS